MPKIVTLRTKVWMSLEDVADATESGLRRNMPYTDRELIEAAIWLAVGELRGKKTAKEVAEVLADCAAEINEPGNQGLLYPMHLVDGGGDDAEDAE